MGVDLTDFCFFVMAAGFNISLFRFLGVESLIGMIEALYSFNLQVNCTSLAC